MALIIVILGIILFVVGFLLLVQSYATTPAAESVIDASELQKVQSELENKKKAETLLKTQLDKISVQLDEATNSQSDLNQLQVTIDGLNKEEKQKDEIINKLDIDFKGLSRIADDQAQKAIGLINALHDANKNLQGAINEIKDNIDPDEVEGLRQKNLSLESLTNDYLSQLDSLTGSMESKIKSSHEQIDNLTRQNQDLKTAMEGVRQRLDQANIAFDVFQQNNNEQKASAARAEMGALENKVQVYEDKISRLEEVLREAHQEANKAKTHVEDLADRYHAVQAQLEEEKKTAKESGAKEAAMDNWMNEKAQLEQSINVMQQERAFLTEKDKMLEEEFVKSRARSMGLEKICMELKKQLEQKEN